MIECIFKCNNPYCMTPEDQPDIKDKGCSRCGGTQWMEYRVFPYGFKRKRV